MKRIAATLLSLALVGVLAQDGHWSSNVSIIRSTTLRDIDETSKAELDGLITLTLKDLEISLEVAHCPPWMCTTGLSPKSTVCYRPVHNLQACATDDPCLWYGYTTRCHCAEGGTDYIKWSKNGDPKCDGEDEVSRARENNLFIKEPDVVRIHINSGKRYSILTVRVCPPRCSSLMLHNVKNTPNGSDVGGVRVAWNDQTCAYKEVGECPQVEKFFSHYNFVFNVTSCNGTLHTTTLPDLEKTLLAVLNYCSPSITTTTTTTPTTATYTSSTTDSGKQEVETGERIDTIFNRPQRSSPNNAAAPHPHFLYFLAGVGLPWWWWWWWCWRWLWC